MNYKQIIGIIIFSVIHALVCGFLGAKSQPIYKKNESRCELMPDEYDIKNIMRKCKNDKAAEACEKIYCIAVHDFAWWNTALMFESISNVPVGYGLTIINIITAASILKENRTMFVVALVVLNVISAVFFSKCYKEADLRPIDKISYKFKDDESEDDFLEELQVNLTKNAPVVKHRCEVFASCAKDANEY
ncbi:MAG: hypothetical protein ACI3W5_07535, partial [Faecousia sp.]